MTVTGSRRRVLLIVAVIAVISTGLGLAVGSKLSSPADAAARTAPPKASRITVPVEQRALSSRVTARGDASFEGAVNVKLETAGGPGVVTGQVPKVGSTVKEGRPLLEVAGRPVLALAGVLPMYRSLRPGMTGPDVRQLEQTLRRLGYHPGEVDGVYTIETSAAVAKLFRAAGYEPPPVDEATKQAAAIAAQQVKGADNGVLAAQRALAQAAAGPTRTQRVQADNAVSAAARALDQARRSGNAQLIRQAEDDLRLAKAQRGDLLSGRDTSSEKAALKAARAQRSLARDALVKARELAGTPLPISEIVYLRSLPRRVDDVNVALGSMLNGPAMSVSGAALVVTAEVDAQTKQLLRVGLNATLDLGSGQRVSARISRITRKQDKYVVVLTPNRLTAQQTELLRSANVRVTIPVKSTAGKVLTVPVAALSAGPDGESRVEVVRADGQVELVGVEVGLSADGYAEIRPVDGRLAAGDQVVVGR